MSETKPRAYVFDAYGTLFDVHAALARHRATAGPDADRLSELWRQKQLEYSWTLTLAEQYADFWSLTERALDYALARFPSVDRALRPKLLDAYLSLDAYPDAPVTVSALKERGLATAILSNGSPQMLEAAVKASGMTELFDAVLSIDTLRVYKPRKDVYALVTDRFGIQANEVVFISSNRWDVMGAAAFGFRPIWINRANIPDEYADWPPIRVLRSLGELAAA
ncbi:MAG TPA: haloacid dehalogenase type II [Xanthobacteraceae bacterium]|jgi:2-haloacid dehalogenase|nr:haloacid dehalogenase type II [Xanthobacteraceae bacterium]